MIIVIKQAGSSFIPNRDFIVRQSVIRQWLLWLKANNRTPIFRDLHISEANLALLPENEEIAGLRTIETEQVVDVSANEETTAMKLPIQLRNYLRVLLVLAASQIEFHRTQLSSQLHPRSKKRLHILD